MYSAVLGVEEVIFELENHAKVVKGYKSCKRWARIEVASARAVKIGRPNTITKDKI